MTNFAVAQLEEIEEFDDGRCPFRPVRHHFGIMTFGVNAMTAHADGDRLKRTAFARDAGTTVLAIGAGPRGAPYEPNGWELFAPLFPLFAAGEYEKGADRAQALIADDPPYAALGHLRRALELSPALVEQARRDEDLAAVRERPEFAEITGG